MDHDRCWISLVAAMVLTVDSGTEGSELFLLSRFRVVSFQPEPRPKPRDPPAGSCPYMQGAEVRIPKPFSLLGWLVSWVLKPKLRAANDGFLETLSTLAAASALSDVLGCKVSGFRVSKSGMPRFGFRGLSIGP